MRRPVTEPSKRKKLALERRSERAEEFDMKVKAEELSLVTFPL